VPALFPALATLKQVHSAKFILANGRKGMLGQGDALLENTPGAVVAVKTADCLPILLVDERLRAVAAVHAGWRGTAANIAQHAVDEMAERFGSRPEDLHAAIGPGIGVCCYEVGPEVAEKFDQKGRIHLDLTAENEWQLTQAGVTPARIYASNLCTMCRAEFHSFRRDKEQAGRLHSFVGIRRR
jgi:polyphenol oxidase